MCSAKGSMKQEEFQELIYKQEYATNILMNAVIKLQEGTRTIIMPGN